MASWMSITDRNVEPVRRYLAALHGRPVSGVAARRLGPDASAESGEEKEYGYGVPLLLEYELDGRPHRAVLHTMAPGPFGHQHMADRAAVMLWSHRAFNTLPRHVRCLDVGGFTAGGRLLSLGDVEELFILTDFAEGREYAHDLQRLRDGAELSDLDLQRADALCDYLLDVHRVRADRPDLYRRRVRELLGHGECIMGLADSYPPDHPLFTPARLESIERRLVGWRWRIRDRTHRLSRVHGDPHPWNILFREGTDFTVLDRSRGRWGEPADDVTCLTLNYVFEALQSRGNGGRVEGPLAELHERFWRRYLDRGGDEELPRVAPPFIVFRALVMASPIWYPHLDESVRRLLLNLIENVLAADGFDPMRIHDYLRPS